MGLAQALVRFLNLGVRCQSTAVGMRGEAFGAVAATLRFDCFHQYGILNPPEPLFLQVRASSNAASLLYIALGTGSGQDDPASRRADVSHCSGIPLHLSGRAAASRTGPRSGANGFREDR